MLFTCYRGKANQEERLNMNKENDSENEQGTLVSVLIRLVFM
jgi:hypothetical protein